MNTNNLLNEFISLPMQEKETIIRMLIDQLEQHEGQLILIMKELEACQVKNPSCIHCESPHTIKRARIKSVQRYSCNTCHKYWMATNGTSLAGLHKRDLWHNYILAFEKGFSIRKAANEVGISVQTSFRWRHRLLASIACLVPKEVSGIIEVNDFQLPRNTKGQRKSSKFVDQGNNLEGSLLSDTVSVLMSVSRNSKEVISSVIAAKKPEVHQFKKALEGRILPGSTLITPGVNSLNFLIESESIHFLPLSTRKRPKKRDPVNLNTNQIHQQAFHQFLKPFNGVATKYLQNYLNWYHHKEITKLRLDKIQYSIKACLTEDKALKWIEDLSIKDTVIIT
jgi:transposase-like protein